MITHLRDWARRLFQVHPDEVQLVRLLSLLLFGNAIAQQLAEITAISNFLNSGGVTGIPLIWIIDGILVALAAGAQSMIVDRMDRLTLMRRLSIILLVTFALLRVMFFLRVPEMLTYSLLYLVAEQQWLFFPLIFWIMTSDLLSVSQMKRLAPLIASAGLAGKLVGCLSAAMIARLFQMWHITLAEVLLLNVGIYSMLYYVLRYRLRPARKEQPLVEHAQSWRAVLGDGWDFVRHVPSFRFLTIAAMALVFTDVILEFHFLAVSDFYFGADPYQYQRFFSGYRLLSTILAMVVQATLTSRLIAAVELKNTFLVVPLAVLVGATWMLAAPVALIGALGGVLLQKVPMLAVGQPAIKAFQSLVPEQRRGRVSMFLDSYLFSFGNILGSLFIGGSIILGSYLGWGGYAYLYLGLAVFMALLALGSFWKMRLVYDGSLLNWRLKRRRRSSSVLEKLDL